LHSTRKTGVNAPRLVAMPALKGEGNFTFSFHTYTWHRAGALFLKCLDYIFSSGMFRLAVNTAKAAAHADFLLYVDSLHLISFFMWYTATACR
jgi:hypothetical protein